MRNAKFGMYGRENAPKRNIKRKRSLSLFLPCQKEGGPFLSEVVPLGKYISGEIYIT